MNSNGLITVYWATALDNVIAGYDATTHSFSKDGLPFLRFQDRCYFVTEQELPLGIEKARHISPTICVLKAELPRNELFSNDNIGGFGMYRFGNTFPVSAFFLVINNHLQPFSEKELFVLQQQKGDKT